MKRVIGIYERLLIFVLARPWWLIGFAAVLIAVSYLCYASLGSNLLPKMDEGGFIVDYIMPPGSSCWRRPIAWWVMSSRSFVPSRR